MIIKIQFEPISPVMFFGNTSKQKWHKYFRSYVMLFKQRLPIRAHSVEVSENSWPSDWKWIPGHQILSYIPDIAEFNFYKLPLVEDKVNEILFRNCYYIE